MSEQRPALIDQLRRRRPQIPATLLLAAGNMLVFVAMLWAGAGLWHAPNEVQLAWGANFGPATQDGEWWRLVSAMFLHFGLLHLSVNMLTLIEAGRFVERFFGPGRFLSLFFFAGLSGNLLSLIVRGSHGISGGASGAIFGLFAALLLVLWRFRKALHPAEYRWLFGGAAGFTAVNLAFGLFIAGIDNAAHVGGLVGGALAALLLDPTPDAAPARRRRAAGWAVTLWGAALLWLLPKPAYDWSDEQAARKEIRHFIDTEARIGANWDAIRQGSEFKSFDELANRLDAEVTQAYAHSFDELSTLYLDPRAPSAQLLQRLKHYAELRRDASHELSEALREQDSTGVKRALEKLEASSRLLTE